MSDLSALLKDLSPEQRDLFLQRLHEHNLQVAAAPTIPRRPRSGGPAPVSFSQERMWIAEQLQPGAAYNLDWALRLRGDLDRRALASALWTMAGRHESLRTTFSMDAAGHPVQIVAPSAHMPLPFLDLRALAPRERGE